MLTIIYDDLSRLQTIEWYGQSLCIFDDQVNEKNQKPIQEMFIRGRKMAGGVSLIYLTQSYFTVPKIIRIQTNYIFVLKMNGLKDIKLMLSEFALGVTQEQLKDMYAYCCKTGELENFFLIDLESNDEKRFRKNFTQYILSEKV